MKQFGKRENKKSKWKTRMKVKFAPSTNQTSSILKITRSRKKNRFSKNNHRLSMKEKKEKGSQADFKSWSNCPKPI